MRYDVIRGDLLTHDCIWRNISHLIPFFCSFSNYETVYRRDCDCLYFLFNVYNTVDQVVPNHYDLFHFITQNDCPLEGVFQRVSTGLPFSL